MKIKRKIDDIFRMAQSAYTAWSKYIVVVPSVDIREGVYKTFQITQDHFAEEYGKKIRFFIYNSAQLTELDRFAGDSTINVMIINSQAFNARGKDARRIAFYEGSVKHIYFVAETKGNLFSMELRKVEQLKIDCAREHFRNISTGSVVYDVVKSYDDLLQDVMK